MPKRRKPVVSTEERGSSELEYNSSDSLLLHVRKFSIPNRKLPTAVPHTKISENFIILGSQLRDLDGVQRRTNFIYRYE